MILAIKFQDSPPPLLCKSAWPETLLVRNLETTRLNRFKEKFKYPLNRVSWKVWERTFIQRKIFTDFWKLQRKPCFYINWKLSKKIDCIVLFKTHEKRYSMRFQGGTPPPSEFRGGCTTPGFFQSHYSEGFWPGTEHQWPPTGWSSWKEWRCTINDLPHFRTIVF